MNKPVKVLLSSGGMDSFLLAHKLGPTCRHVFVDVGQRYLAKEARAARETAMCVGAKFDIHKGSQIAGFEHESGIIPFRNAEMVLCAAQYGNEIHMGVLADEINSDKSLEFMIAMEEVMDICHRKQYWTEGLEFKVLAPLRNQTKTQAVGEYLAKHDLGSLLKTVSCYSDSKHHCGRCASCFKRWVAFINNDIPQTSVRGLGYHFDANPAHYRNPADWPRVLAGYAPRRAEEVSQALRKVGLLPPAAVPTLRAIDGPAEG